VHHTQQVAARRLDTVVAVFAKNKKIASTYSPFIAALGLEEMSNNREIQCIKRANEAKVASAQRRLKELCEDGLSFDSPLGGGFWGIDWKKEPKERIKQILLMPIAFVLIIFLALMVPIAYLFHLLGVRKKKQSIKNEIAENSQSLNNIEAPTIKTLESLWHLHGLDKYQYNSDEQFALLADWIEILYGKKIAESLNVKQRVEAIADSHIKANQPYYEGESGAAHFFFTPPLESLIRKLSEELCKYDQVV
jgi:hypothetical protein